MYLRPILHQLYILLFYCLLPLPLLFNSHSRPLLGLLLDFLSLLYIYIFRLCSDLGDKSGTIGVLELLKVVLSLELVLEHAVVETSSYLCPLTWTQRLFFAN